jgi:predicted GH43/DUF377 family glycosyl hydrolase
MSTEVNRLDEKLFRYISNSLRRLKFGVEYRLREKRISPYIIITLEDLGVMFNKRNSLPENVFYDEDEDLYYLAYTDRSINPPQVGLACSRNLLEWHDLGLVQILGCGSSILDAPHLIKYEGKYYLFFAKVDNTVLMTKRIYLAVSENVEGPFILRGLALDLGNSWDSGRVDEPFIMKNEKLFYMLYMGAPSRNINREQIGVALANKLEGPWIKYSGNPVLKFSTEYDEFTIADPHILEYKEVKLVFYACSARITGARSYGSSPWLTAVAYTKDFKTYKKLGLLKIRTKDCSRQRSYFRGSCVIKGENLYFVYTGQDYKRQFYPMLAYAPLAVLDYLLLKTE